MDPKKIARINELAKKKKTEGLTAEEKVEQAKLREEYIEGYRRSVRHHIEGIKIVDEDGNDVTPEKLRQVQREKGLHGRSLDESLARKLESSCRGILLFLFMFFQNAEGYIDATNDDCYIQPENPRLCNTEKEISSDGSNEGQNP